MKTLTIEDDNSFFFRFLIPWMYEKRYTHLDEYGQHDGESRARFHISMYGLALKYEVPRLQKHTMALIEHSWDEKCRGEDGCNMLNLLESISPISNLVSEYGSDPLLTSLLDRINAMEAEFVPMTVLFKDYEQNCPKFGSHRSSRRLLLREAALRYMDVRRSPNTTWEEKAAAHREYKLNLAERLRHEGVKVCLSTDEP